MTTPNRPTSSIQQVPWVSREDIERKAQEVRRLHGLTSIPVNPVALANRLGFQVNNAKFSDDTIVGMIAKRGENVVLLVNHDDPPFRKRFTIAHELGHHFLHMLEEGDHVDSESDLFRGFTDSAKQAELSSETRREIQANMFAAALLMPEDLVRSQFVEYQSVETLSQLFGVSKEAMAIRLTILDLI